MSEELVIDGSNFSSYFKDVKKTAPCRGDVMARYIAKAELIAGEEKGYLIDLLISNPMGAEMGVQIARNAFGAQEMESVKLCKMIAIDLMEGKTKQEVMEKPYSYTLEKFFWTKEEYVPKNNPHWEIIKVTIINPEKLDEEE